MTEWAIEADNLVKKFAQKRAPAAESAASGTAAEDGQKQRWPFDPRPAPVVSAGQRPAAWPLDAQLFAHIGPGVHPLLWRSLQRQPAADRANFAGRHAFHAQARVSVTRLIGSRLLDLAAVSIVPVVVRTLVDLLDDEWNVKPGVHPIKQRRNKLLL